MTEVRLSVQDPRLELPSCLTGKRRAVDMNRLLKEKILAEMKRRLISGTGDDLLGIDYESDRFLGVDTLDDWGMG